MILAYADLPRSPDTEAALDEIERTHVTPEHVAELDAVARLLGCDRALVRQANYHYDGMKLLNGPPPFACTAIATQAPTGPIHARNLDWFTSGGMLATATLIVEFRGAPAGEFTLVTWPGFVGALSAVAPGRFAVTLNFVTSGERFQPGAPLVFVLRDVLETATTFDEARDVLLEKPLPSDALILLTGIEPDERLVIERTPSRAAIRAPDGPAPLVVTNDYRAMSQGGARGQLAQTSCTRYDRAVQLAPNISTLEGAVEALEDDRIRMGITAQHMAMQAATGMLLVELPEKFRHRGPPPREGLWRRLLRRRR